MRLPPPPAPALRFGPGAGSLCRRLAEALPSGTVRLGRPVTAVTDGGTGGPVTVEVGGEGPAEVRTSFVIVAVPPRLAATGIRFEPALPGRLTDLLLATPTWMAEALKCVVVYPRPFWRDAGRSGTALSERGPLVEVHDASPEGRGAGALWGLVGTSHPARALVPEARRAAVVEHLVRLFGPAAGEPLAYLERDWSADPLTAGPAGEGAGDPDPDPATYGHAAFGQPLWEGRLHLAGAETASPGGGHMEGAVRSGQRAAWLVSAAAAPS